MSNSRSTKETFCNKTSENDFVLIETSCELDNKERKHVISSNKEIITNSSLVSKADSTIIDLPDYEDFVGNDYGEQDDEFDSQFDDYEQSIARASFGDMVNDYERNQLFYKAIQKSIRNMREMNVSPIYALDIGCGTGLLSMMAIRSGADKVLACDTFKPIADCAHKIINKNGMDGKINIVPKQSNYLNIGANETKPNLLVAELLDTELIGEGCLFAYRDAVKRLTSKDAHYVPSKARIFVQLVQSEQLFHNHQFRKCYSIDANNYVNTPKSVNNCFGSHILHDIQMNRLKPGKDFEILSEPQIVFEFEFNNLDSLKLNDCKRFRFPLLRKFTEPILIFSWWNIDMDYEGEFVLSCAPYWAQNKNSEDEVAWRDHWMQTIYYLPAFAFADGDIDGFNHEEINANKSLLIDVFHDSFSFWFDLPSEQKGLSPLDPCSDCWSCHCGLHSHLSRSRLYSINNDNIFLSFWNAFQWQLNTKFPDKHLLKFVYFGDESVIPLLFATHAKVYQINLLCQDTKSYRFFEKFLDENEHLHSKILLVKNKEFSSLISNDQFDGIISDLYFKNFGNFLPSLEYFNLLRKHSDALLNESSSIFTIPNKVVVKCLLVEFKEFWKSFADVGSDVEGFDLSPYDELIQNARRNVDWTIEPHQVWEYSCKPLLEKTIELFDLNLCKPDIAEQEITTQVSIDISHLEQKFMNLRWPEKVAFVVWTEFHLDDAGLFVLSGGPENNFFSMDEELSWSRSAYQGVGFLGKNWLSQITEGDLTLKATFTLSNKNLLFCI